MRIPNSFVRPLPIDRARYRQSPRMCIFALTVALGCLCLAAPAAEWTLLEGCEEAGFVTSAPSAQTPAELKADLSSEREGGANSLLLTYTFSAAQTWQHDVKAERRFASLVDLSSLEELRCSFRIAKGNPSLILTINLVDELGAQLVCGDYTLLKHPTSGWTKVSYRLTDFRKTRWVAEGRSINLSRIAGIAFHIKNDAALKESGTFSFQIDEVEYLSKGGLLRDVVLEDFEAFDAGGAPGGAGREWKPSEGAKLEVTEGEAYSGNRWLRLTAPLSTAGQAQWAVISYERDLDMRLIKYMRFAVRGDARLVGYQPAAQVVLEDFRGSRAIGTAWEWGAQESWSYMHLALDAEGVEGYKENRADALEYEGASCWREDFDDGLAWDRRTDLGRIRKIYLRVAFLAQGRPALPEVSLGFDRLVAGFATGVQLPMAATKLSSGAATAGATPTGESVRNEIGAPFEGGVTPVMVPGVSAPFLLPGGAPAAPSGIVTVAPLATTAPAPTPSPVPAEAGATAAPVQWLAASKSLLESARIRRQPVVLYFRLGGNAQCDSFEASTLLTSGFNQRAQRFLCLFEDGASGRAMADAYRVYRYPTVLLIGSQGQVSGRFTFDVEPAAVYAAMDSER